MAKRHIASRCRSIGFFRDFEDDGTRYTLDQVTAELGLSESDIAEAVEEMAAGLEGPS